MQKKAFLAVFIAFAVSACDKTDNCNPERQPNCREIMENAQTLPPKEDVMPPLIKQEKQPSLPASQPTTSIQGQAIEEEMIILPQAQRIEDTHKAASAAETSTASAALSEEEIKMIEEQQKTVSKDDLL